MASVVRYFGGVKLGAGGLVRAYTDAVAQALLNAQKIPIVRKIRLNCTVPYEQEGWLRRQAEKADVAIVHVSHENWVAFEFELPHKGSEAWMKSLNDQGHGKLVWRMPDETIALG
jgi:putative IMPACT (imprinted ancient) family translation regulator